MSILVIKLGTSTLTGGTPNLSRPRMADLARQIAELHQRGRRVVLVSSGAIAAGRELLGDPDLPRSIPAKQMLAAVGQPRLMERWTGLFGIYGLFAAQVLLTRADLDARPRFLNARSTLWALLGRGVLPVINENDTVATEEIRVGDNDNLSALVANLVHADRLILLTDRDGLFTADPHRDPNAALIERVDGGEIPPELWAAAGGSGRLGVGGMRTKLEAAELARRSGASVVIARGDLPDVLLRLDSGEQLGTLFTPTLSPPESFKRFVLSGVAAGALTVDRGAAEALHRGGSLLPPGIVRVDGVFGRGAAVRVLDPQGVEIARGLAGYTGEDCARLAGLQSREIEAALGYYYGDEVIHRDNLVVLAR
ncbi:MAG TPA: glutamate 5-kinase [Anaerolineales bacterium]|nr:glutamate 5-kinase [Anaerolineales bacterium]